jgi:hypothetical protein
VSRTGEALLVELAEVRGMRQRLTLTLRSAVDRLKSLETTAPKDWQSEVKAELELIEQAQRLLMRATGRAR